MGWYLLSLVRVAYDQKAFAEFRIRFGTTLPYPENGHKMLNDPCWHGQKHALAVIILGKSPRACSIGARMPNSASAPKRRVCQ